MKKTFKFEMEMTIDINRDNDNIVIYSVGKLEFRLIHLKQGHSSLHDETGKIKDFYIFDKNQTEKEAVSYVADLINERLVYMGINV